MNKNNKTKKKNRIKNNKKIKVNNIKEKPEKLKKDNVLKEKKTTKKDTITTKIKKIKKTNLPPENPTKTETKKISNSIKLKLVIILITSVLLICGIGITYSLFTSKGNLHADQKIAKFVFEAKKTDTIQLPITNLNPGDKTSYNFQVTNNSNDKKSEVTINYELILKTYHFMPLEINLYKIVDDKEELVVKCDETISRDQQTNQIICNTKTSELSHNNELSENYRLDVSFPKQYNSLEYAELVDHIEIQIKSWQKM